MVGSCWQSSSLSVAPGRNARGGGTDREASDWWTENRPSAQGLFRSELRRAFDLVTKFPAAAPLATNAELPEVRRVLMQRAGYQLYYRAHHDRVEILAFWHSSRGEDPKLS